VGRAAEFGALAEVASGLLGGVLEVVHARGEGIDLAAEHRHPEGMLHIGGSDLELDRLADRDVDLVGGADRVTLGIQHIEILRLPPELVADDANVCRIGGGGTRLVNDCPHGGDCDEDE
jgi:hypothetical protein